EAERLVEGDLLRGDLRPGSPGEAEGERDQAGTEEGGHAEAVRLRGGTAPFDGTARRIVTPGPRSRAARSSRPPGSAVGCAGPATAEPVRRGWDSNPRCPRGHVGFQDRCIRPLCHPSGSNGG